MTKKRTRRTRAELKELMVNAGKEVLDNLEPNLGFEHLTYSAVFEHLQRAHGQKVTIGSVHERIWGTQRDFQLEVLADAIRETPSGLVDLFMSGASAALDVADLDTIAGRRYAAQNITRMAQNVIWIGPEELDKNDVLALTLRFRLFSMSPGNPEAASFLETITQHRQAATDLYVDAIKGLMEVCGMQVRPEAGDPDQAIEYLAVLGNAIVTGFRSDVIAPVNDCLDLPTGPSGEMESWHPTSWATWGLVRTTCELAGDDLTFEQRTL